MKQASQETRERAIQAWKERTEDNKKSIISTICACYNIGRTTFYRWRKREAEGGEQRPLPKGHPPKVLSEEDLSNIKTLVENEKNDLSAREIGVKLGLKCHPSTIWRALKNMGYSFKKKV